MNVFMGYNPLAGKQVKITTFNAEVDGDGTDPLDPKHGDCILYFADSIAEQEGDYDSVYMFDGDDWTEPSGGGGATFPTFTSSGGWTCDLPYGNCAHLITQNGGTNCPCMLEGLLGARYALMRFDGSGASRPIAVWFMGDTDPRLYYYSDGRIEEANSGIEGH